MSAAKKVVVVAVDFSACGDDALQMGLAMVERGQVEALHLVHVLDPRDVIDGPEKPALVTEEEVLERAPTVLLARAEAIATLGRVAFDGARVHAHARIGRAVPTLIQACIDYEADLLLVGTHARRGMERLLLGSVAEALVREAPCPVLVARPKDYLDRAKTPRPDPAYPAGQAPLRNSEIPFERTRSTTHGGWDAADTGPTGFRIV